MEAGDGTHQVLAISRRRKYTVPANASANRASQTDIKGALKSASWAQPRLHRIQGWRAQLAQILGPGRYHPPSCCWTCSFSAPPLEGTKRSPSGRPTAQRLAMTGLPQRAGLSDDGASPASDR